MTNNRSIGQDVILLDSSQSVRAITDLELGDRCKTERQLLLEEIETLKETRDTMFQRLAVKDSTITAYREIDMAYQEIKTVFAKRELNYKSELRRERNKRIGWMVGTFMAVTYIIIETIKD